MKRVFIIFALLLGFAGYSQVETDTITQSIRLEGVTIEGKVKWKKGDRILLENLVFVGGTSRLLDESQPLMEELLLIMQVNPRLKIEIQGHVCCYPDRTNKLSKKRAKTVYDYLKDNGIDKSRISYKDFGGRYPIHPMPEQSDYERSENRRVEIEVLAN